MVGHDPHSMQRDKIPNLIRNTCKILNCAFVNDSSRGMRRPEKTVAVRRTSARSSVTMLIEARQCQGPYQKSINRNTQQGAPINERIEITDLTFLYFCTIVYKRRTEAHS